MSGAYENHRRNLVDIPEGVSGGWRIAKFTVEPSVASFRLALAGRDCPPGEYTRLSGPGEGCFMSDTPAEWRDVSWLIAGAVGDVLISGLGLGMVVKGLLARDRVTSVTVIEKEADVIKLVAPSYADPRVRIIEADAFTWKPDRKFDLAWHDIWPNICADNLPEMTRLRRHYQRAMTAPRRQFCWAEGQARRQAQNDRRFDFRRYV